MPVTPKENQTHIIIFPPQWSTLVEDLVFTKQLALEAQSKKFNLQQECSTFSEESSFLPPCQKGLLSVKLVVHKQTSHSKDFQVQVAIVYPVGRDGPIQANYWWCRTLHFLIMLCYAGD